MADPRPWRMMLPLAAVVAVFGLWSVYWLVASHITQTTIAAQRQDLASHGLTLACGTEAWGGYPFRFEFSCTSPVITAAGQGSLSAYHLLAVAQAYNFNHVILLIDGPTTAAPAAAAPITVDHDRALVSIRGQGDKLPEIEADIPNVKTMGPAQAADLQLFARPAAAPGAIDIAARLKALTATLPGKPPLAIDSAQLIATLDRPMHATVTDLSATHGPLRVWSSGEAGIDPQNRPAGEMTLATNDLKGLMALADPQLSLTQQQRSVLTFALAFLGKDAKTVVKAENGQLFLGHLQLGALQPLF